MKYFVDEKVVSILFQVIEEEKITEILDWFANMQMKLHDEVLTSYLLEKGYPEVEIKNFIDGLNTTYEVKIKQEINSSEFMNLIDLNINSFLSHTFSIQSQKLSEDEKNKLNEYVLSKQQSLSDMYTQTNEFNNQMLKASELVKELGVSDQELKEMIDKALDDAYAENGQNGSINNSQYQQIQLNSQSEAVTKPPGAQS